MFVYYFVVTCVSLSISIGYTNGAEYMETKADFLETCQIKDPNFVSCSTHSVQLLFTQLGIGIKGLEDLQYDPKKLKTVKVLSNDGPVSLNITLSRAYASGFSKFVVVKSEVSPIDYSFTTKFYLPKLRIDGHYRMQGRILVLPLVGSGECWVEASGMDITVFTKTKLYEKFGHIFYNITELKSDYQISGLKMEFKTLFGGATVLEQSTNQYLNENWKLVAESVKPILVKAIEDNFAGTFNKVFHFIPADYLVSDIAHPSELYGTKPARTQ